MIKIELQGILESVGPVKEEKSNGKPYWKQVLIVHIPEEEFKGHTIKPEWYVVQIYSTSSTDSRFVKMEQKNSEVKCSAYLKGERWSSGMRSDYNYNHKLTLNKWLH
jgi:hypothetical protein